MANFFEICYKLFELSEILAYSSDEIVINITHKDQESIKNIIDLVEINESVLNVNIHKEIYTIEMIPESEFCIQNFENGSKKLKNVPALFYPFVVKHLIGQEVNDDDRMFYHEGYLAKFINVPNFNKK